MDLQIVDPYRRLQQLKDWLILQKEDELRIKESLQAGAATPKPPPCAAPCCQPRRALDVLGGGSVHVLILLALIALGADCSWRQAEEEELVAREDQLKMVRGRIVQT